MKGDPDSFWRKSNKLEEKVHWVASQLMHAGSFMHEDFISIDTAVMFLAEEVPVSSILAVVVTGCTCILHCL